jgi:hypothetical protein
VQHLVAERHQQQGGGAGAKRPVNRPPKGPQTHSRRQSRDSDSSPNLDQQQEPHDRPLLQPPAAPGPPPLPAKLHVPPGFGSAPGNGAGAPAPAPTPGPVVNGVPPLAAAKPRQGSPGGGAAAVAPVAASAAGSQPAQLAPRAAQPAVQSVQHTLQNAVKAHLLSVGAAAGQQPQAAAQQQHSGAGSGTRLNPTTPSFRAAATPTSLDQIEHAAFSKADAGGASSCAWRCARACREAGAGRGGQPWRGCCSCCRVAVRCACM